MLSRRNLDGVIICSINRQFGDSFFCNGSSASIFNNVQFNKIINITLPQNIDF